MKFREISPYSLPDNPFVRFDRDWGLVTAGDEKKCNTMTVSWGQLGIMWNKPVVNVYLRPQRYTREFVEAQPRFSLSFFAPETQRPALQLLGTESGRDGDKIARSGLHVCMMEGVPAFEEAALVLLCRKLYSQDMLGELFLEEEPKRAFYPEKDYHRLYIAEIEKALVAE